MEMIIFIALSLLLAVAPLLVKSERATRILAGCFFLTQVAGIALIIALKYTDVVMLSIFRTDTLAVLFHILMTAVLGFALIHSSSYLKAENVTTR
jgi:NADH:ubiquinone oxidoreductase subunit 2 (subunit N)